MGIDQEKIKLFKEKARLFFQLCSLDMKQKTAGTALGFVWLYLNPLVSIAVIWFVFTFGLKGNSSPAHGIQSLLVGLISWQLIQETIMSGMGAFIEKPFLVKKIKFPLEFLPLIKVTNSFRVHLPFLILALLVSIQAGQLSFVGIIKFVFALPFIFLFLWSAVLLFSTITVFYRDFQSFIGMIMQLLFWATPIFWPIPESPKFIRIIENFNPVFFIVKVYRYCFLNETGDMQFGFAIFMLFLVLVSVLGIKIFSKLKDQFADVL